MRNSDVLDRMLAGEQVEGASQEVRELAQLASVLQGAWGNGPSKAATTRTRAAVLSAFNANGNGNGSSAATAPVRLVPISRGRRLVARVALAAALVTALPAVAMAASEDALPGQLLYPVKRGFEEVRLALADDPVDEATVLLDIAGERVEEAVLAAGLGMEEAAQLAREGYEEAVARFDGRIVEAQALGLSVDELLEEATDLFASYQQVFEAIFGAPPGAPAPGPTEVLSAEVPQGEGQAGEKSEGPSTASKKASKKGGGDGHKRDGTAQRGGGGGEEGRSGGQVGGAIGNGADDGKGGGGNGGKGGNGGNAVNTGGAGGAEETDDEGDQGEDGDDEGEDGDDDEHGEGQGVGHDKGIGEGHHKDKGEGHTEG